MMLLPIIYLKLASKLMTLSQPLRITGVCHHAWP